MSWTKIMASQTLFQNTLILRRPKVDSKKAKRIRNYK